MTRQNSLTKARRQRPAFTDEHGVITVSTSRSWAQVAILYTINDGSLFGTGVLEKYPPPRRLAIGMSARWSVVPNVRVSGSAAGNCFDDVRLQSTFLASSIKSIHLMRRAPRDRSYATFIKISDGVERLDC